MSSSQYQFCFSGCYSNLVEQFRQNSQLRFCLDCDSALTCPGNKAVLRVVLLILKHLIHFGKEKAFKCCLEAVLGPAVVDCFRKRFCRIINSGTGFGNPIYQCQTVPSVSVMPGLSLQANLNFSFDFASLHGETYGDFLSRVEAEGDRDS